MNSLKPWVDVLSIYNLKPWKVGLSKHNFCSTYSKVQGAMCVSPNA
jgi:hypothetical protein